MDVSSIASLATEMSQAKTASAVGVAVLKKAIDINAQNSLQLLQALPQISNNPANLGNKVDAFA